MSQHAVQSTQFNEQGIGYAFNIPVGGLSSNLNLLEDFSPSRNNDPFSWIPQGLYYDMIDNRNDRTVTGNIIYPDDNVFNYSNQQFFNAFTSNTSTVEAYRENLISLNLNNQTANVRSLFSFYKY